MFLRLSWILTLVQAFEGPLFDEDVGPDVDVSQNDQFSDTTPKSQMSSLSGLGRTSSSSAQSISLDPHTDPARFSILQQKNFNFCGYPAVRHNHNLFNVGPATEISTAYPLPQNKYQKFENGTFGSITRIVNGDESSVHSWPWQVRVRPCNGYRKCTFLCGGSIISSRWVLTAAHCIPYRADRGNITVGNHILWSDNSDLDPWSRNHSISKIINHENWNKYTRVNDITLIQVASPFQYNEHVSPVCLPTTDTCINYGSACAVTGWGYTEQGKISSTLQELAVRLIPHNKCQEAMYYSSAVYPNQVCAGFAEGGKDSCSGDSGGPLVCKASGKYNQFVLYGLVSWGYGCARQYKPGVYTRVTSFLPWIYENLYGESGSDFLEVGPKSEGVGDCMRCKNHLPGECDDSIDVKQGRWDGRPKKWSPPVTTSSTMAPMTTTTTVAPKEHIDTCGGHFLKTTTHPIKFSTPNYPNNYNPKQNCYWKIGESNKNKPTGQTTQSMLKIYKANFGSSKCGKQGADKIEIRCLALRKRTVLCKSGPKVLKCPGQMMVKFFSNQDDKVFPGAIMAYQVVQADFNACGLEKDITIDPKNTFNSNQISIWPTPRNAICEFKITCPENTLCRINISSRTRLGALERRNRKTKKTTLFECYDTAEISDSRDQQIGNKVCGSSASFRDNKVFLSDSNVINLRLQFDKKSSKIERFEAVVSLLKI